MAGRSDINGDFKRATNGELVLRSDGSGGMPMLFKCLAPTLPEAR